MREMLAKPKRRFYSKTLSTGSGCLVWTASKNPAGYGWFRWEGQSLLAHRVAWVLERGPIPEGLRVLHSCDNPSCVKIDHLWIGTQGDNVRDMDAKGRRWVPPPGAIPSGRPSFGEHNGAAKITNTQAEELRNDYAAIKRGPAGHPKWGEVRRLVEKYGLDASTIRKIGKGIIRSTG